MEGQAKSLGDTASDRDMRPCHMHLFLPGFQKWLQLQGQQIGHCCAFPAILRQQILRAGHRQYAFVKDVQKIINIRVKGCCFTGDRRDFGPHFGKMLFGVRILPPSEYLAKHKSRAP